MKLLRNVFKAILYFLLLPITYLIVSLILTYITVNNTDNIAKKTSTIYLNTNGVHLDILIPIHDLSPEIVAIINYNKGQESYVSFGWGDENFYLNTPTWGDLTFKNAFTAMLWKSDTLLHTSRYTHIHDSWKKIRLSPIQLEKINTYILSSFKKDKDGNYPIIPNTSYPKDEFFYKANGSYSIFKTCNSWVNTALKESELKACLWTPFDFGLFNKYE